MSSGILFLFQRIIHPLSPITIIYYWIIELPVIIRIKKSNVDPPNITSADNPPHTQSWRREAHHCRCPGRGEAETI